MTATGPLYTIRPFGFNKWIVLRGTVPIARIARDVTPAFPASTHSVVNSNEWPVKVKISGGTLTAVKINTKTVATVAGTYTLPSKSSISVTYSVKPHWVWSSAGTYYSIKDNALIGSDLSLPAALARVKKKDKKK